jgi:hypothetical protein
MASPNARIALMALPTYCILAPAHRDSWLDHLERLGLPMSEQPQDGEVFQGVDHCRERLDAWGFREGCRYVTGKNR